jgi:hypothetical protein
MNNQIPKSKITITCWGCNKSITKSYFSPVDCAEQLENLLIEGWVQRYFSSTVWSWFCGHHCAYNSFHARQAELWWKQHGKRPIAWHFIIPSIMILICFALATAAIFMR